MQQIRTTLTILLHIVILAIFFLGPTYAQLYLDWLPQWMYGIFTVVPLVWLAIGLWLVLGMPGMADQFGNSRRWWVIGIFVFTLWAWLSVRWSLYPEPSQSSAGLVAMVGLFAYLTMSAGPTPQAITTALAAGIIFQSVVGVTQVAVQHPLGISAFGEYQLQPHNAGLSVVVSGVARMIRPYGLSNHPNTFGGYLAFALLSLVGWLKLPEPDSLQGTRWRLVVRLTVTALGVWGLWLSFSRSAWGAFVIGLFAAAILIWAKHLAVNRRWLIVAGLLGIVLTALFGLTYRQFILARAVTNGEATELRSISDRRYYTGIALQAIYEHPLVGIGVGAFPYFAGDVISQGPYANDLPADNVHNVPLLVFSELGLIGIAIWALVWLIGFVLIWRGSPDLYTVGLVAGVIALHAAAMLDHYTWSMPHFAFMLWGAMGIALRHTGSEPQASE